MSIARTPWLIVALAALIVGAFSSSVAVAQTDDTTAQRLAAARVKYERDMESVRRQVNNAIAKKIDDASKAKKADTDKIAQAVEEKKAFQASGAWPEVPNVTRIRNVAAEAATELQSAYSKAKGEYVKAGKLDLADAITKDLEQFKTQSDIVPWSPNLIEKEPLDAHTLAPGSKPLTVDLGVKGEYRLEIRAKRTGDTGTLTVEIPLVGGKRLAVPALVGKDGDIRLVLTVREGYFGADLGAARPMDLSSAKSSDSRTVSINSDGAAATLESMAVKPVIEGRPLTVEQAPKQARDRDEPKGAAAPDEFPMGRKWSGMWDGNACDIEVVERGANNAAIRISRANGAVFRLEGPVANNVFSLEGIKHVRVAKGGAARFFTRQSGTAYVRDGRLYVDCTTTNNVGSTQNQKFDVSISGAKPK